MKITLKRSVLNDAGLIVACPIDTEATVSDEMGKSLVAQGLAVARSEKKHAPKAAPEDDAEPAAA